MARHHHSPREPAAPGVWTEGVSGDRPSQWAGDNTRGTAGVVRSTDAAEGAEETADLAKAFGEFVISEDGQQTAADAAPMSENLRTAAQEALDQSTLAG